MRSPAAKVRAPAAAGPAEEADAACSSEEEHRHLAESMSRLQDWDHLSDALSDRKERYPQSAWVHRPQRNADGTGRPLLKWPSRAFGEAIRSLHPRRNEAATEAAGAASSWEQGRIQNAWYEIKLAQ